MAKKLNVSQPTISRTRKKLEKEGYIKEYTIIPDYHKLGFQIVSFTLAKLKKGVSEDALIEMRKETNQILQSENVSAILTMRGTGLDADYITVSFHESYDTYRRTISQIRQTPILEVAGTRTFIASLGESHFRPLTHSALAQYLARMETK